MARNLVRLFILSVFLFSCGGGADNLKQDLQQTQKVADPELQSLLSALQKKKSPDAYLALAQYYAKKKEVGKATSNYQSAIRLDSTRWDIRMEYGGYAYYNNNTRGGLEEFKLVLYGNDANKYTQEIASYLFEYKTTQLTFGPHNSTFPAWSPDGSKILFQSDAAGNWDIHQIDAASEGTGTATAVIATEANEGHPTMSNDGRFIAYTSDMHDDRNVFTDQRFREIMVYDTRNNIHDRVTRNYLDDFYPRFNRYNDEMTYITEEVDEKKTKYGSRFSYLFTMNSDGSFQIPAMPKTTDYYNSGVKIQKDQEEELIFFTSTVGSGSNYKLYSANNRNKRAELLYNNGSNIISVDVSPNGKRLLFTTDQFGSYDLMMTDRFVSRVERLTSFANDEDQAIFSPDGTKIVFHSNKGGQYDLYLIDLNSRSVEPTVGNLLDKINSELF